MPSSSAIRRLALLAALSTAGCVSIRSYGEAVAGLPPGRLLEVGGQRVSVEQAGEGRPLVLLHGFGGSTLSWSAVLPELARQRRVVAIDLNGFGFTERPRDPGRYTLRGQGELVLAVLDSLGIANATFAGHSYGGAISLHLASTHPERVDALLLVDNAMPRYAAARRSRLFHWRPLADLFVRSLALGNRNIARGLREAYFDDAKVTPALVRAYAERLRIEGVKDAFYGLTAPSKEPPVDLDLATIAQPALVVWGKEDELIDVAGAEEHVRDMPRARFVALPGCGHSPMEECPADFLAAVREFLSEN